MKRKMLKTVIKCSLTCAQVEHFLMDYLEGRLDFWSQLRFRFHMLMCPDCPKYLQEYKNAVELGKKVFDHPEDEAIGKVPEEILHAIMAVKKSDS
ncbi:MAG: zf-HC2 domain-containing protein [Gammaproteobacteria bacterium]|nr:zf-HC2 domain-containing protein [Gammaproteobacteria bacterium]